MKRLFLLMLVCVMSVGFSIAGSNRVVGYYPEWGTGRLPISQLRYDKLDHIIYFSISPNADGTLDLGSINLSNMQTLATTAHSNGVDVSICVGGWQRCQFFSSMTANPTTRASFVSNMHQLCIDYDLDGVDLDWEPVSSSTDRSNYTKLIKELKTTLSEDGLLVTVAVASFGSEFDASAVPYLDWVNIMAYDMGTPHSSYSAAISTLTHWENFGFPREKEFLGVPFYGRSSSGSYTYKYIMHTYAPAGDVDLVDGINFNGYDTIKAKAEYACNNGYGGIMIWEISQDTSGETSLLTAISDGIEGSLVNRGYIMIPVGNLSASGSSGNAIASYSDPQVVVDGTGMLGPGSHTSNGGSWFTDGSELDRWITVDLGGLCELDHMKVYNANEGWDWNMYGFRDSQIFVSEISSPGNCVDDPDNWTLVLSTTFAQAPGVDGYDSPEIVDLRGNRVRHVGVRALNTYNPGWGTETAGLSELQIFCVRLLGDLNGDGCVDIGDLSVLGEGWLGTGDSVADVSGDGRVDLVDVSIFADEWMLSTIE